MEPTLNYWRRPLDTVPDEVWRHPGLRVLILADTGLTSLPPEIGDLRQLRTLDLGHNRLTELPPNSAT